jgi:hypothetical protein
MPAAPAATPVPAAIAAVGLMVTVVPSCMATNCRNGGLTGLEPNASTAM